MRKFTGYYRGWDRCECGATLVKVGDRLRHRAGFAKIHAVVMKIKGGMSPRQAFKEAKTPLSEISDLRVALRQAFQEAK